MISFSELDESSGWAQRRTIYRFPEQGARRKVEVRYRCRQDIEYVCFLN